MARLDKLMKKVTAGSEPGHGEDCDSDWGHTGEQPPSTSQHHRGGGAAEVSKGSVHYTAGLRASDVPPPCCHFLYFCT